MALFDFLKSKSKSVVGIDMGSSSLKVVQLKKQGGKAVLETYGEIALGPYTNLEVGQATNLSAEEIVVALKDLMREAHVTSTNAGISIPFARSLLTLVELPRRQNKEEQKTIIELEARKYIPVPVSEVQLDWFVVPEGEPGKAENTKVNVLLVAVHNDELALLQAVAKGAGVDVTFFEIEIFGTIRAVVDEPIKPVMVLDMGAATTKAYIVERGIVALSHTIPSGGQDATRSIMAATNASFKDAEAAKKKFGLSNTIGGSRSAVELTFSRIFAEARRVVAQYETLKHKAVASIILTGGGGVTKELAAYAQTAFSIDVQVANPFAKTEAPAFLEPVLKQIGPEFAVAVGIALRKLEEV